MLGLTEEQFERMRKQYVQIQKKKVKGGDFYPHSVLVLGFSFIFGISGIIALILFIVSQLF